MSFAPTPPWLHRLAVALMIATLLLIASGASVTSTGSGLAVPDWPLSFGQVFPPMVGGVLYEHSHRMAAAVVGMLTITLMVLMTRWEPRAWLQWVSRTAPLPTWPRAYRERHGQAQKRLRQTGMADRYCRRQQPQHRDAAEQPLQHHRQRRRTGYPLQPRPRLPAGH